MRTRQLLSVLGVLAICASVTGRGWSYAGGNGTEQDPYQIADANGLIYLASNESDWDKHFVLVANIDLSGKTWFGPVVVRLLGTFNGNDLTIRNLRIKGGAKAALFGEIMEDAKVLNLGLADVNIVDAWHFVGALAGENWGTISNCSTTGSVTGRNVTGGLVGRNGGIVNNCTSTSSVGPLGMYTGGLIGQNDGSVTGCRSHGTVTGSAAGGLVGFNNGRARLVNCHGGGTLIGSFAGGLVGRNAGSVTACYSSGEVRSSLAGGGLTGVNAASIDNCFSTAAVTPAGALAHGAGGLVGNSYPNSTLVNCYSTGRVGGPARSENKPVWQGGLVGVNNPEGPHLVVNCFWDTQASECTVSAGGTGLTTAQMKDINTYLTAGWDFAGEAANGKQDIWKMPEAEGYPLLFWQEDTAAAPPGGGL